MPETEKEKHRTLITKAKKTPPPEPFRTSRPVITEAKKVPPPEPTRKTKHKEVKRE